MAKEDFYQEADDEITFNIINQDVLNRLKQDGEIDVPKKVLDVPKDKRWNKKQMASKILQGLESGSSISDIAGSMMQVIGNNEVSAIRNTRTMVTSAENHGRLDSYKSLSDQGVVMKKEWIATPDDRTRPTHMALDGEEIDLDAVFSNGCRFPGDARGPAEEVWMCRCAMGTHIIGFRRADGSISKVDYQRDETLHDRQMAAEKAKRVEKVSAPAFAVVNGKDISAIWQRRSDKFDFEIEDIINAQGFDGLPRVVDAEEFDRYVEESNFIAQRGYTAPDEKTLKDYQQQLYEGKWYVDCSKGGSAYGRGMYGAFNNGTELDPRTKSIVEAYGLADNGKIETFTLDSSAKIIQYKDALKLQDTLKERISEDTKEGMEFQMSFVKDKIDKLTMTKEEKDYVYGRFFGNLELQSKSSNPVEWYKGLDDKSRSKLDDFVQENVRPIKKELQNMIDIYSNLDEGEVAALYGYDAIVTRPDHGEIIVLNRTKIIFKGE